MRAVPRFVRRSVPRPGESGRGAVAAILVGALLLFASGALRAASASDASREDEPLLVFAAASLADALTEIGWLFETDSGLRVDFQFAGSNLLARQIAAGAPADLLLVAGWEPLAVAGDRVDPGRVERLFGNRLVVIVPAASSSLALLEAPRDLLSFGSLAIADPMGVPAGVYARRWLESEGLWREMSERVIPSLDVRAALASVAAGHAPAGIVYATDLAADSAGGRVRVVYRIDPRETPGIGYFLVSPMGSARPFGEGGAARRSSAAVFAAFLRGEEAAGIFESYGFEVSETDLAEAGAPEPGAGPRERTASWRILFLTLRVALAATLLILPFGIAASWALARPTWPGRTLVESLISLPLVLPPTAVGLVLLLLLGRTGLTGGRFSIAFTWWAAVLAAAVVSFPLLVRPLRGALEDVDPRLVGVARTLGRGPLSAFLEVHLPLAWRGLVGGTALAFSRALGEFGATVVVAGNIPGRTQTLALGLFQRVQVGDDAAALRLAGISALLAFATLFAANRLGRGRERRLGR